MCDLSLDPVSLSDMTLEEGPLSGAEEPEALGASAAAGGGATSTLTGSTGQAGTGGGSGGTAGGEGEASVSSDTTPAGYTSDGGTEVPCIPALNTARLVARMK